MQQQIPAKFHPDRSTFGRITAEKPVFWPIIKDSDASDGIMAVNYWHNGWTGEKATLRAVGSMMYRAGG